jgi:hypothetical protein
MKDKVRTKFYFLIRFFRDGSDEFYAENEARWTYGRRSWGYSSNRANAYEFPNAGDARQALRSTAFADLILGRQSNYGACLRRPETAYYWEIIKVTETLTTSFAEETIKSDPKTPAMLVIARAAQ